MDKCPCSVDNSLGARSTAQVEKVLKTMLVAIAIVISTMTAAFAANETAQENNFVTVSDAVCICREHGYEIDSRFLFGDMESNLTVREACHLLRSSKHIPLLNPVLYGQAKDAEIFTAEAFQYRETKKEGNELITLGEFCKMAEKAMIPIEATDVPETDDGIEFKTSGSSDWAVTTEWVQQAKTALLSVPDKLVDHFNENGYVSTLMTTDEYDKAFSNISNVTGSVACYSSDGGFIWSTDFTTSTMAHEMGHHLMYWFGDYGVFEPIYAEEVDALCTYLDWDYAKTNIDEGFAVAFSEYVEAPEVLKTNCPKTFDFIKSTIDKVPE